VQTRSNQRPKGTLSVFRAGSRILSLVLFGLLLAGCSERRQGRLIQEAEAKTDKSSYREAAEILKRAVALNPESRTAVKALYKLGFVQETYLRDFDGALFNYNEFIRLSRDPVAAYEVQKRVASLYLDQTNDPDKAVEMYRKLLRLSPETLEGDQFQLRMGQAYFRMNDFEKAREEYQGLIDRFPKSHLGARARYEIGNAYYMEGRYEIALEALKQVVRFHPQSEFVLESQFLTAQCLEHLDKFSNALQVYESIADRYRPEGVIQMRIAEVQKKVKKQ
jgi:tetratricopeptide (TPR) repeat protein